MAPRKKIVYSESGRLQGQNLTDKECEILDALIYLADENGVVEDLKHTIFDLSEEQIEEVLLAGPAWEGTPLISDSEKKYQRGTLRDYQTVGVAHLYYAKRAILGDSVGLGKTVQISGTVNLLRLEAEKENRPFRYLFLTESTSNDQVRREMIRFTGEYVGYCEGTKSWGLRLFDGEFDNQSLVAPHSLLRQPLFIDYVRQYRKTYGKNPFDLLMVDESSILGNTATQTFKAAFEATKDIENIYVANGTPFETALRIFYAQLHFVDPSLLPSKTDFGKRYELQDYNGFYPTFSGKYKNQEEFRDLIRYRYITRTRKQLGAKFTNCTAGLVEVPLTKAQRSLLDRTSMPQMVYDCPWSLDPDLAIDPENCQKLEAVEEILDEDYDAFNRVLIYCHYKEAQYGLASFLRSRGHAVEIINGDMSTEEKLNTISDFNEGYFRVLITNVQKGLNFGNVNGSILYSFPSNTNAAVQFEGRMTRDFDVDDKHIRVLVTKGREEKRFRQDLTTRAKASDAFAGSDYSMVLMLLLQSEGRSFVSSEEVMQETSNPSEEGYSSEEEPFALSDRWL